MDEKLVQSEGVLGEERQEGFEEKSESRRIQNLTALLIIMTGLFVGSLFVDAFQLVSGQGFSLRALKQSGVIEAGGRTWVAYDDAKVQVKVLSDAACKECDPSQAIVALRRALPTIEAVQVDIDSPEGKSLVGQGNIKNLPAFFFDPNVEKTQFYAMASTLFGDKTDSGWYAMDAAKMGMTPGKFLELPTVSEGDLALGDPNAPIKVVEFSDWQCPYCRAMHPAIKQMLSEYKDKVYYVYKQFPLTSIHPQANNAALASACANDQGKWFEYGDYLFAHQDEWSKTSGTQVFKNYARTLRLDTAQFNKCLDEQKYADHIQKNTAEGESFGISGTPGTFVNDKFLGGYVGYDELKQTLDGALAK